MGNVLDRPDPWNLACKHTIKCAGDIRSDRDTDWKRIVELVAVVALLKLVPDKASDGALMGISGLITGMMVSLYAMNGTMFRAFAFYMIALVIVGLYAVVVKIICGTTGEGMSQIACMVARLHNSFLGTAIIVTILLLNIILEVKILKFF